MSLTTVRHAVPSPSAPVVLHRPVVRRFAIALAGLLACSQGVAQTISTAPAAVAPVPLDHPAALALLVFALAAVGIWMVRSRAGGHGLRVLGATAIGVSILAAAGFSSDLRAAIGIMQATFTAAGGQTLTIPIDPSPSSAAPTDFTPVEYINQSGVPLRVSALTPPVTHTACFPGAIPSPLPATPLPPGTTACAVGTQMAPGGACTVNVAALCAQAVAQIPGAVLAASPSSLMLQVGGSSGGVTITNTGSASAIDIAAQIPPNVGLTLSSSTCSGVLPPLSSCTLTFLPGGSAEGPVSVMVAGSNTNALQVAITANAAAPAITAMAPTSGPATGGTSVVISGSGFTGTTQVAFGGINAVTFTVDSDTQITAATPVHAAGTVDITVSTPGGTATAANGFVFKEMQCAPGAHFEPMVGANMQVTTGLRGVLCIGCGVTNPGDLTSGLPDSATLMTPVSVAASVWARVQNTADSYNGTRRVGFLVSLPVGALDQALLQNFKITTYLNGTPQQTSASVGSQSLQLLNLPGDPMHQMIVMQSTQPFNGVELEKAAVLGPVSNVNAHASCVEQ
jgi:hypothetical protein